MNDLFTAVGMPRIPRNNFDLTHEIKTSFDIGELMPTAVIDCIPGDSFRITPEVLLRLQPMVNPVMHRMDVYHHFFFVPYRLLWDSFPDFISQPDFPDPPPLIEIVEGNRWDLGTIGESMGLPIDAYASPTGMTIAPYNLAAYRLIYDEYYRDQDLIPEKFVPLVSGDNTSEYGPTILTTNNYLYYRSIEHDYFSSCRPFAQKGDPVTLPLTFANDIPVDLNPTGQPGIILQPDGTPIVNGDLVVGSGPVPFTNSMQVGANPAVYDPNGSLTVDIQAQAVTLETLRTAIVMQEFLERDARSGTRYIEKIQGQFGVRSSDARLQRPEYIGGHKAPVAISEVLSTAQSDNDPDAATQFVGQMAGHGISVGGGHGINYYCEEHGVIIGIISVLPEPAYSQGIHRMWVKADPYEDFAWPAFANLGEQAVKNYELYAPHPFATLEFGYQSRYAEYKSIPSRVTGEMRTSLSSWHMAFDFDDSPSLNAEFIEARPDKYSRIFAVTSNDVNHLICRVVNHVSAKRLLPRYGIPSFGSTSVGQ